MKGFIKSILSQQIINIFYHFPVAVLANIWYGFPARGLKVIGVTGTDGKSTTTNMIYHILKSAGKKVSMVSTINAVIGGKVYETGFHVTSPDPFVVQKFARTALNNGDEYLILEVTSHALDQYRFWGIKFDVGVITNITHEHLDYHKTLQNYSNTKLKLLNGVKTAVINQEIRPARNASRSDAGGGKIITFGLDNGDFNQKEIKLNLKIPGDFNIENGLAALGVAFVLDIDRKVAVTALEKFEGISGRMEEVKNSKGLKIFIDFAHTPNGLEKALRSLRSNQTSGYVSKDQQTKSGRLIAVIGAEGYRDVGKRAMMGEVAQRLADLVVVTAVDPRGQLNTINKQITEGAVKTGAKEDINFFVIDDRRKAIQFVINKLARKGDIIGIFGKGHESSMNLDGKTEIPWSDFEVVKKALNGY